VALTSRECPLEFPESFSAELQTYRARFLAREAEP
jgi:hypothetical protein